MDWKKIWEASKWLVIGVQISWFIQFLVALNSPQNPVQWLVIAFSLLLTFWLGYNGMKTFKLNYKEVATAGAILGIVTGIITGMFAIAFAILWYSTKPGITSSLLDYYTRSATIDSILLGLAGVGLSICVSLLGAFIAKKLK